jgi:hypothetical protein
MSGTDCNEVTIDSPACKGGGIYEGVHNFLALLFQVLERAPDETLIALFQIHSLILDLYF